MTTPPVPRSVMRTASLAVFGSLLASLDGTIVNVAFPTLRQAFGSSIQTVQWTVTGYLIALALSLPISGWLTDRFGAKAVYVSALLGFSLASGACALAPSVAMLIAFRVLQGGVAGILAPMGQTIVAQIAGRDRLGRVMSVVSIIGALGGVLGAPLGGVLLALGSWRWVFLVNVPIGAAAVVLALRRLPSLPPHPRPLDLTGALLLVPGVGLLAYGLTELAQRSAVSTAAVAVATGAVLSVGFVLHSRRQGSRALLDVRLFQIPSFSVGVAASFAGRFANDGALLLIPLYLTQVRFDTALQAGLVLSLSALGSLIALPIAGQLNDRLGARFTGTAGSALGLIATIPFLLVDTTTPLTVLAVALFARGLSASIGGLPPVASAYRDLDRSAAPTATTTLNIATRLGSPAGTATLAALLAAGPATASSSYQTAFLGAAIAALIATGISALLPAKTR